MMKNPDQWVDAEKLRELVDKTDEGFYSVGSFLHMVKELLPAPPLPTLADMSLDELKVHIGEKVTVDGWANPSMLVAVIGDEGAVLAHRLNKSWPFVEVRPLSDLALVTAPEQLEAENKTQTEQIKRLQVAMSSLMKSYRELDYSYWLEHHAPGMDTYTQATIEHYGLLPGDMEATDV